MNWKKQAAEWLRHKAEVQALTNEAYPEHAKAYSSWTERIAFAQHWAADLEREAASESGEGGAGMSGIQGFAKIVAASDGRQVLFYIDPNGGDYVLHQIAEYGGVQADMKLEFSRDDKDENERRARAALAAMDQDAADRHVAMIRKFVGEDA